MTKSANQLVEHFFRHESANLIAVLTRVFGIRHLGLVEDMVQAAMLEAMRAWKQQGVPDQPAAWIHRVARNRILDALRREKIHDRALAFSGQSAEQQSNMVDRLLENEQLPDSLLRMMFVCCHPALDRKTQIALTLKTLCGFGVSEIARGLLLPSETVKKRLQRGRKALATTNVKMDLPDGSELIHRLESVHDVLYLMFNEGYSTSQGQEPIRDDICEEAARLCHLLCESDLAAPSTRALLALQLFHAARLDSRTNEAGHTILLEEQDRTRWDHSLICAGSDFLAKSKTDVPSRFHLEAAIALQHCLAPSVQETNWPLIVQIYSRLLQSYDSPIYRLNRAIAIGQAGDPRAAIEQLTRLKQSPELKGYLLLDSAIARMYELLGDTASAKESYRLALSKATAQHERDVLEQRLRSLHDTGEA